MDFSFCFDLVLVSWSRRSTDRVARSIRWSIFLTASAPMSASNSAPYFSRASRYSSSVRSCLALRGVGPGSTTM